MNNYLALNRSTMFFLQLVLVLLLTGCGRGYELKELYCQRIGNSKKSIVEYQAWSTLNDGAKFGKTILDVNESLSIEAEQMPFKFLIGNPTKDTLFTIELREGGVNSPEYLSTDIFEFKGLVIKTDNYIYNIGSSHNLTYKFSSFKETKDSLIFFGLEKVHFNVPNNKNEIKFLKGNIKVVESDTLEGVVSHVEIPAFLFRNFNNTSLDKVTVIRNDSLKVNGLVYFILQPTNGINSSDFSDYGLYKKRKI